MKELFFFLTGCIAGLSVGVIIRDLFSGHGVNHIDPISEKSIGEKVSFLEPISDKEIMESRINQLTKHNG